MQAFENCNMENERSHASSELSFLQSAHTSWRVCIEAHWQHASAAFLSHTWMHDIKEGAGSKRRKRASDEVVTGAAGEWPYAWRAHKNPPALLVISTRKRQLPAPPQGGVKVVCLLLFTCSSVASCRQVQQAVQWSERTHCLQPADEILFFCCSEENQKRGKYTSTLTSSFAYAPR
jgi:hypothetical protein